MWRRLTPTDLQPVQENTQELTDKALTENKQADFAIYLATLLQEHPELEQILSAWTALPEHIKQTIQTLVGSVTIAGKQLPPKVMRTVRLSRISNCMTTMFVGVIVAA